MEQIHKRFSSEQVKQLLEGYLKGLMDRADIEEVLGINKTRFFALLKLYRHDPKGFTVNYNRRSPSRLSKSVEEQISRELLLERSLLENRQLPISSYIYSAVRDRLLRRGIEVSLTTIIERAKVLGCHRPRPKKKAHEREVITTAIGALIQHDASHHLWSPYAPEKWTLISSIDDYSRKILFADFFKEETTWAHIQASEALLRQYGLPLRYYVDSLRVFRFVRNRDSFWYRTILKTDEAAPQWKQVLTTLNVDITYALSPQAKGKIERSYRWLQDRIVRTAAIEKLSTLDELRPVLKEEVFRYNHQRLHATTGEIPDIRFEKARRSGRTLFRPFSLPSPYTSPKDVFCLREKRTVNAYRRIEFYNHQIPLPKVLIGQEVDIHLVPDLKRSSLEVRLWSNNHFINSITFPLSDFPRVHF